MRWKEIVTEDRQGVIIFYQNAGYTQKGIAEALEVSRETIRDFCRENNILGWQRGAQLGNKNAFVHGFGRNTIRKLTKKVILASGRSLFICERCSEKDPFGQELPRHHKDRDRNNNNPINIEVLCNTCHAKEHISDRSRDKAGCFT